MIGNPSWKGYDTDYKKACSNWGIVGKKQVKAYRLCKKWGKNPQHELARKWDQWLNELSDNEEQLVEMKQKRDYLDVQIDLIEKNNGNTVTINEKLLVDIDERINLITDETTYQWIYAVVKNLSYRYDLGFNEIFKVFNERIPVLIKNNQYKEQILYLFKYVGDRAKNGALSDQEIENVFPRPVKA